MSDIFISYSSEDRDWVIRLADLLQQQGWTVWWDRSIPFGKSFQEVIEAALNEANCVIVVWSKHSVNSGWVSAEADEARNRDILVPILIDDVSPPLVFRQLQTANMADWDGETSDRIYQKLVTDIGSLLAQNAEKNTENTIKDEGKLIDSKPERMEDLEQSIPETAQSFHKTIESAEYKKTGSSALWGLAIAVVTIVTLIGLWFAGIISDPPTKQELPTPVATSSEQAIQNEDSENSRKTEIATKVALYANLFDEAMQEEQLKLAARYVKKANSIAPENTEALRISTEYEAALQLQTEQEQLTQQKNKQEEAEQKIHQATEAEANAKEQANLARLARLADEKQRKEKELQQELRLEEDHIQREQATEEAAKERLQAEKNLQEEELAEQQRLKDLEEKHKAEEEAANLQEEEAAKEKARQKELRRRMLSR